GGGGGGGGGGSAKSGKRGQKGGAQAKGGGAGQKGGQKGAGNKGGQTTGAGQGTNGGGGGAPDLAQKNTSSSISQDFWGPLPAQKPLERAAYPRERFMDRYQHTLRQYYRTIAERGQRKD